MLKWLGNIIRAKILINDNTGTAQSVGWRREDERLPSIITDRYGREAQIDAFDVMKVSRETIIANYRFNLPFVSYSFDKILTASGTWELVDDISLKLNSGASSSSGVELTSKRIHKYVGGKGIIAKCSVILGDSGIAGNTREWGLYNDSNGVFIRLNGTQYEFVLRYKGSDTVITADNWNIPVTPDENGHIWYIQYQWLGVGNFYIYYDGELVYVHEFLGSSTNPSMANPDLPIRFRNYNTTNTTDVYLQSNCASVCREGTERTRITDGNYEVGVTPEKELMVKTPSQHLLDEHFNVSPLNPNAWTQNLVGSGSISVADSFCELNVTTASGDSAEIYSVQSFQHIFSQTYSFRTGIILDEWSLNNNTRIWGMRNPTTNDGWYYRLQNGILQVCTELNSVVTAINIDLYKPTDNNIHRFDAIYRNYRILFYIDGELVYTASSDLNPLYKNENLKPYFRNYNTGVTSISVSFKIEGLALFDDTSSSIQIAGLDDEGLVKKVSVTTGGRLKISQEPPDAPSESTPVDVTEYGNVSASDDNTYVIPNGETLVIQRFSAGAEVDSTAGNVVELWYDPNGTGIGMTIIDVIFCSGDGDQHDLREEVLGDGTKAIRMRRRRFSGGSKEIFGRWEGYY